MNAQPADRTPPANNDVRQRDLKKDRAQDADHRLEHWVHWSLLVGLTVSSALLVAGLAVALRRHEQAPEAAPARLAALIRAAADGSGASLLDLGLLALIATPVVRVAVLAVGWTAAGERRFAAIAWTVLALLAVGMTLGLG